MVARPLLGFFAVAGVATSAFAQRAGIEFQPTNHVAFIYVQGQGDYHPFLLNVSTVVHINAGFVLSTDSKDQVGSFLGKTVGILPSLAHAAAHSITMRIYWQPDRSGTGSVLPIPAQVSGSDKATVFRSNIIVGDDRNGVPLRLTGVTFTAN